MFGSTLQKAATKFHSTFPNPISNPWDDLGMSWELISPGWYQQLPTLLELTQVVAAETFGWHHGGWKLHHGHHGIHGIPKNCATSHTTWTNMNQWYTKVSIDDQDKGSTLMVYQGILVYWSSRYLRYTKVFYEQPQSGRSNNNNTNFFARLESLHSVQPRPSNFSQSMVNVLKWWCKTPFLWIQTDGLGVHWCTLSIHIPLVNIQKAIKNGHSYSEFSH